MAFWVRRPLYQDPTLFSLRYSTPYAKNHLFHHYDKKQIHRQHYSKGKNPNQGPRNTVAAILDIAFLSITVTFTLCFIIHRSFTTSCSLICSIGSDHTYTSSPLLFPFIWMVLPYICPYRFISLWEIQAPSGRQSVKNCSCLKHLEGHKLIVFARPFTAQSFWTA